MALTPAIEWWRPVPAAAPAAQESLAGPTAPAGRLPFVALMVFTFVLLLAPQSFLPALGSLRLAMLSAGVGVAALALEKLSRGESLLGPAVEMRIALALALWAAVTVPLSLWPAGSLGYLIEPFCKTLVLLWLLANVVVTTSRLRITAWSLTLMTTPLAATGLWNLLSGVFVPEGKAPGFARIAGYDAPLTANPNDLALTLNLILPLGVALLLSERRPLLKLLAGAIVALDALAVVATFSRGGFLTLATILLAYVARLSIGKPAVLLLPLLALLCVPLLPSGYLGHMETITSIATDPTGSAQERWSDLAAAGRIVLTHPITGAGIGMNALAMNAERGATWRMVHNVYLQYGVELGLPGLALFLALLFRCLVHCGAARRAAARAHEGGSLFHIAEAVQIGLIAFAVAAFFHPVGYHFYFFYLAGLAVGVAAAARSLQPRPEAGVEVSHV